MAEKLIVPGHIADLKYVIPAIQTYVEADDWLSTSDYINREFRILKKNGVENDMKSDLTDYTKDAELPRYFGFVERKTKGNVQSDCRITPLGKRFFNAYTENDKDTIWETIMIALESVTFGTNNDGCPNSESRLEAPNILLVSSLILDGVTRQEYATILSKMLNEKVPIANAITHIKIYRKLHKETIPDFRVDNKVIPFLVTLGFLLDDNRKLIIPDRVLLKYADRISRLRTVNDELFYFNFQFDEKNEIYNTESNSKTVEPRQQIFYGAPGTGKSHGIKKRLEELKVPKENVFRTTFHPDSDYSSFVGAYKPTMKKQYRYDGKVKAKYYEDDDLADAKKDDVIVDKVIQYDFIPQTFIKAYVRAYQTTENVYLIIEEINRGNCAQIFGDLFQLLDRDENGFSEYTIKSDADLRTYLEDALGKDADGIKDGELCLPSNLYIWATMNTSDQSLFPIDSAFKRRWDWKYEPIKYENSNWKIEIGGTKYLWTDFQKTVNNKIFADTSSEDKMLGDYFVNPPTGIISEDLFLNKILFYLWNDVCKDGDGDIFKTEDNKDVKFSDLYGENGTTILLSMMRHLEVFPIDGTSDDNDEEEENEAEGPTPKRYSINGEVTNKDGKKWGKGTLVKRAVEIYCEKHPSETAEQIRNTWMSLGFKIPHLIETKDDKEKRLTNSRDKTARERAREIILSNGESIYVSTEVGSGAVLDGFGDFLTKIQSKPEWGISIQEL